MNFIIVSPRQKFGGAIVLHVLCKLLNEHGYNAKIFYFNSVKKENYTKKIYFWICQLKFYIKDIYRLLIVKLFINDKNYSSKYDGYYYYPVRGCKRKIFPFFNKKKTIVVYPEIVYGNFLRAEKVVRWFLYYYQYEDDNAAYTASDLFIAYRDVFNNKKLNPELKTVQLLNFDYDLYKQTNFSKREGKCYIIRKGRNRKDLPEIFDGIVIDNLSEYAKVRVFNECKVCISYDMQTFYTTIAALCGCKVICIPEKGKTRSDYLSDTEKQYGISYGYNKEELEYAEETRFLIKEYLSTFNSKNEENIIKFIDYCKKHFEF